MKKKRTIKGWAVINTELNEPCLVIPEGRSMSDDNHGSAIFVSDWSGHSKHRAQEYKKTLKEFRHVKIYPITITY